MNDWCALFKTYTNQGGNLYLQTQTPNAFITTALAGINETTQEVTCIGVCTGTFSGSNFPGVRSQDGFALSAGTSAKKSYQVAQGGIIDTMDFTCDATVEQCPQQTGGTLYVGDYLPDTIPFAATNNATTIEVYFCDWEVAYNLTNSGTLGCQSANLVTAGQATAYANILSNP